MNMKNINNYISETKNLSSIDNYITEFKANTIEFNVDLHGMQFIQNEVDAADSGIDFKIEIHNNKVVGLQIKSEDYNNWKKINIS